jgi:hypothetical protein
VILQGVVVDVELTPYLGASQDTATSMALVNDFASLGVFLMVDVRSLYYRLKENS